MCQVLLDTVMSGTGTGMKQSRPSSLKITEETEQDSQQGLSCQVRYFYSSGGYQIFFVLLTYFLFNPGYQTDLSHLYNFVDNNRHNGHSHTIRLLQCNKVSCVFSILSEAVLSLCFQTNAGSRCCGSLERKDGSKQDFGLMNRIGNVQF